MNNYFSFKINTFHYLTKTWNAHLCRFLSPILLDFSINSGKASNTYTFGDTLNHSHLCSHLSYSPKCLLLCLYNQLGRICWKKEFIFYQIIFKPKKGIKLNLNSKLFFLFNNTGNNFLVLKTDEKPNLQKHKLI